MPQSEKYVTLKLIIIELFVDVVVSSIVDVDTDIFTYNIQPWTNDYIRLPFYGVKWPFSIGHDT